MFDRKVSNKDEKRKRLWESGYRIGALAAHDAMFMGQPNEGSQYGSTDMYD